MFAVRNGIIVAITAEGFTLPAEKMSSHVTVLFNS